MAAFFTLHACNNVETIQTPIAQQNQSLDELTSKNKKTDDSMYVFSIQDTKTGLMLTANLTLEKDDLSNKTNHWRFRSMGIHAHSFYQQIIHGHSKKCLQITKTAQGQTMQLVPCEENDLSQFYTITGDPQTINGYPIENLQNNLSLLGEDTIWRIHRVAPNLIKNRQPSRDPAINRIASSVGTIECDFLHDLLEINTSDIDSWQIHPTVWEKCKTYRQSASNHFKGKVIIEQGSSTGDPSHKDGRNLLEKMRQYINTDSPNACIDMMYIEDYDSDENGVVTQNEYFHDRIAFFKEHYPMIKNITYAFGPQDYRDVWLHGYRFDTFQDIKKAIDIADGVVIDGHRLYSLILDPLTEKSFMTPYATLALKIKWWVMSYHPVLFATQVILWKILWL